MKKTLLYITILLVAIACKPQTTTTDHLQVWLHRANSIEKAQHFQYQYHGMELDVHYDDSLNTFFVKHDFDAASNLTLDEWCAALENVSNLGIWFDFKNLNIYNAEASARCLKTIRDRYRMQGLLIVEGSASNELRYFRNEGFSDSYYIPFFDPKTVDSIHYQQFLNEIQDAIDNGVSHISGYDFQYEFMKKEFPEQHKLFWTINEDTLYQAELKEKISRDTMVDILLFPNDPY